MLTISEASLRRLLESAFSEGYSSCHMNSEGYTGMGEDEYVQERMAEIAEGKVKLDE